MSADVQHVPQGTRHSSAPQPNEAAGGRRLFSITGLFVLAYLALWVGVAAVFEPNLQFFSYYAVNYDQGFIRRGLAGELLDPFPPDRYFTGLLILRWLVPALFVASIAAVAWTVATRFVRSERRIMLALLIPMLPFGIVRAVLLPTPDLLGQAALALFALVLSRRTTNRSLIIASGAYGVTTAVLTLIHEAVPFLQALGAVLAIAVLSQSSTRMKRLGAIVAVAPGLVVAMVIALAGRRDASLQCDRLPHKPVDFPMLLSPSEVLRGEHAYVDYHDWTCRFITVTTRSTPLSGVDQVGWVPWISSTLTGLVIVTVTMLLIRAVSGVPVVRLREAARGQLSLLVLAALLLVPVFATSSDWARWWVAVSFGVGLVYLLYASQRPESTRPATRRTRVTFGVAMVVLALFPILVAISAGVMVQPLVAQCGQLSTDPQWVGICP